jgi:hypothetical protein
MVCSCHPGRRFIASPRRHRKRLVLEPLEGRWVPSTVSNLADAGAGSLRQAIIDTPAGGTVDFQPGLSGTIALKTGELLIDKDLTITAPGESVITVSGNHVSRAFDIAAGSTMDVSGLTIADGSVTGTNNGGGILNAGTLTVTHCLLNGNSTASGLGGGLGGGIYNGSGGTLTFTDSTLSGNSSSFGGGILNYGTLTVSNSTLSDNSAYSGGGGGIYNYIDDTLTLISSTLSGNSAGGSGGGILNFIGTATVTGSTLSGNSAGHAAGGIFKQGTLNVTDSTLSGNSSDYGAGIFDAGTLALTASTLSGNAAGVDGGGIYNNDSALTITNSTLSGNSASNFGGGIYNVRVFGSSTVTVTSSTLSGNSASNKGGGFIGQTGTVMITSNSILAGNTAPSSPDVAAVLTSQGYNLIGDGSDGSGYVGTDLVGTADMPIDPMLGLLQDNGGPTRTMALLPGSPALDAGDPAQLGMTDQRGVVRTDGVNIGAYQASATAFVLAAPNTVSSGVPFDVTVTAVDPFGQVALGYTGTVTFSTTDLDPSVVLPADYTFTPDDQGVHTFTNTGLGEVTLVTPGVQMLTVTDTTDNTITGSTAVTVTSPDAPEAGRPTSSPVEREREAPTSLMTSSVLSRAEKAALDLALAALHQEETSGTVW